MTAAVDLSPAQQCLQVARTRLLVEARAGEVLWVTGPFGAVALLLVPMAVGASRPLLAQLGVGMYWVVVLLFGVLVSLRQSATDSAAQLAALRLTGIPPAARLAGHLLANTVVLLVFEALLLPAAVVFYQPELAGWPWLLPVLPLVAAGLAAFGTLAGALAHGLAGRSTLGPLLVSPLCLPLLLGATEVLPAASYGRRPWSWLLLTLTAAAVGWLAVLLSARPLEDLA